MNPQSVVKIAWASWAAIWLVWNFTPNRNDRHVAGEQERVAQAFAVIGLGLILADYGPTWLRVPERLRPGLAWLVVACLAFSIWARHSLGDNWASMSADRKETVRVGPYAFTEHPIYLGTGVAAILSAPVLGNASAGAGAAVLVMALFAKAFMEQNNAPV